ncbi:hypothetical protein L228DRAFT_93318 [Xylona heveae TC161]|uniref:Uncharacterized protein n=1 Tax=Xylona heveae (strain CBS 132557 / TC161) TaxID=1328760 RepID=A0A165I2L5_XYLHT|nr:hypothetical protein L228DRAFT_93318 [Xylona heveae TC161]KZF24281.1 hypothetical protein L228DRAFT_93318 [Xylona heveae TC161]
MAAIQLSFTLRTSANVKTVHLLGSWDNYSGQLPLSKDSSKTGGWKGTFRFPGSTLKQGQRYWYYYIMDGYHVSHDPAQSSTVEPTTGRKLNILDVPVVGGKAAAAPAPAAAPVAKRQTTRNISISSSIVKGRSLSPSKIQSPKPIKPHETRYVAQEQYMRAPTSMADLESRLARAALSDSDSDDYSYLSNSPPSSVGSSLSSRSDRSSPSSLSSYSDESVRTPAVCTCERYGITRKGDRVKLDCGGTRCGYLSAESESDCSSESEHEATSTTRRQIRIRR